MLRIAGIDHLVLRARDQEALVAFYVDVLGLAVERRQDSIGLVQLRAGSSLIDIVGVDGKLGQMGGAAPGAEGRNLDHFCLNDAGFDMETVRAHLLAHGVEVGHNLARLEIRILTEEWVKRMPSFELKSSVRHHARAGTVMALESLPLVWTPKAA